LHGDILQARWLDPCPRLQRGDAACSADDASAVEPPRCVECGGMLRPGVVWFGESLPPQALEAAERAAAACSLMLVVGTSGAVWPAAGLAGHAWRHGARVVIVNDQPAAFDGIADAVLRGSISELLPAICDV